jgi:hypothetical protein
LWLRRATIDNFAATLTEQAVATLCGLGDASPPVAALSYLDDFGELPNGYCLRADPVHLRTDTGGLILFDSASFELGAAESRALVDTLAGHLAVDGWTLAHRDPRRWYLVGERPQELVTTALPALRGTPVPACSFTGTDAPVWTARLNELQMLMHNHPVNQARAARGQVPVNSLWLWGGGEAPAPAAADCSRVLGDNPFARGCARYCDLPAGPPGARAADTLPAAGERQLVVLEDCRTAAAYDDFAGWQTALQRLEHDWFAVLLRALRTGRLERLDLLPLNGRRYCLPRRRLLAVWKGRGDYRGERRFRHPDASRV